MPRRGNLFSFDLREEGDDELADEIQEYEARPVTIDLLRLAHQNLRKLSPDAYLWFVPHYLKLCLTDEGKYSSFEAEFFVYSLSPAGESDTSIDIRLSALNADQIRCIVEVLSWMLTDEFWGVHCPEQIHSALEFLEKKGARLGLGVRRD